MGDALQTRVINLDRSPDRLTQITAKLSETGLAWTRYAATDMRQVQRHTLTQLDEAGAQQLYGRSLSMGEIGCYLSHLGCLEEFIASDAAHLLVLEDDADPAPTLADDMAALIALLDQTRGGRWQMVNLSGVYPKRRKPLGRVGQSTVFQAFYPPVLTTGLLWTRAGAQAFLAAREGQRIAGPIDDRLRRFLCRTSGGISTAPPLVAITPAESTIGDDTRTEDHPQSPLRRKLPNYLWAAWHQLRG